MWLAFFAI